MPLHHLSNHLLQPLATITMAPSAIAQPTFASDVAKPLKTSSADSQVQFDVKKHLAFEPPSNVLTMEDLSLNPTALSPVATTELFPLLSHEAVQQHRRELFNKDALDNCPDYTRPGAVQLRGMAPRYAPFIHQFWNSPEVLKMVSDIAGVELVPAMDYEISHTNVQLGPGGLEAVKNTPVNPPVATEDAIKSFEKDRPKQEATDQSKPII
jgi:hypothetical protein